MNAITNPKTLQKKAKSHTVTPLDHNTFRVTSGASGNEYLVRLQNGIEGAVCDCPWGAYRTYGDHYRSGCSHVQAVYRHLEGQRNRAPSAWASREDAQRQRRPMLDIGDGVILTSRRTQPALPKVNRHQLNGNSADFVLGGNATFTIENTETGNHFTFKVVQPAPDKPHFVRVLTGPDNENDFTFLGTIFDNQTYRHGKRSPISPTAQSAKVFEWAWPRILSHSLPQQVHLYHEGRCGRCGHKLTVPESIESGFGPECITKLN